MAGQIIAPGPGSYRAWMRGSPQSQFAGFTSKPKTQIGNPSGVAFNQEMIEDNSTVTANSTELTGVHLIYQGEMRGDLFAKSLTFRQGVRVAQQSVRDFDSTFDARTMDQLSNGEMTLDCDQLTVSVDPAKSLNSVAPGGGMTNSIELACAGGVYFRSRTEDGLYEITADQCGYTVAKDLFTIQGVPNRPARFQKTDPLGRPSANLAIRNMTMRLKTMEVLSSQIESFQLGQLPGAQPRK